MSTSANPSTPAGWYHDGTDPRLRYWDGTAWTDKYDADAIWIAVGKPLTGIGAQRFRLTDKLLTVEKGTLSTKATQIGTHDIQDVDGTQTITQKARGVGNISITAMRSTGRETFLLEDVPNFRDAVRLINEAAQAARDSHHAKMSTSTVNYAGVPPQQAQVAPAAVAAASATDLNAELAKLATFKEQGILDDEEFAAAKRKLLGL
jgi:hypothetical protein